MSNIGERTIYEELYIDGSLIKYTFDYYVDIDYLQPEFNNEVQTGNSIYILLVELRNRNLKWIPDEYCPPEDVATMDIVGNTQPGHIEHYHIKILDNLEWCIHLIWSLERMRSDARFTIEHPNPPEPEQPEPKLLPFDKNSLIEFLRS